MNREELVSKFKKYLENIDSEEINTAWKSRSKKFIEFWNEKIMNDNSESLTDSEIDEIILILDKNAKGSTKQTISVAKVMIPQGVWRRLFHEIKSDKRLHDLLNNIFKTENREERINLINELYEVNRDRKNSLTGWSANAINTFLFVFNPLVFIAVISLNDREKIISYYDLPSSIDFENDAPGKKIIESNEAILNGFKDIGLISSPRIISQFLYIVLKDEWRGVDETEEDLEGEATEQQDSQKVVYEDESRFYMEKELENFLIKNWEKTELGAKYDLIEENGDSVSQQYQTDIGKIDILVKNKETGEYVVIELKRDQSSDNTVGQILRYIGWVKKHKSNGQPVQGIIIAGSYDDKLDYALEPLKEITDIQVFIYKINFSLSEFKK